MVDFEMLKYLKQMRMILRHDQKNSIISILNRVGSLLKTMMLFMEPRPPEWVIAERFLLRWR
jgi:hypothetical protein